MYNILTIDLEDYFQVHAFSDVIKYDDWSKFECRIERNTNRLLAILNDLSTRNCSTAAQQHRSTSIPQHRSTAALNNNSVLSPQHLKLQHSSTAALNNSLTRSLINPVSSNPVRTPPRLPKATFFVLGWIAERYPDLVRRIQKEGHEIACHGYAHQLVYTQSRDEFRQDIKRAKSILEDITGKEVIGYRAPSYSITDKSQWAFEVLVEEGFKYDSSVFPIHHDFYGMPEAPRFPFNIFLDGASNAAPQHRSTSALRDSITHLPYNSKLITQNSKFIVEFPISTIKMFGQNFPISGGGYFRLFPYSLIRKGLRSINEKEDRPFIFYLHPWELDFEQPKIRQVRLRSRFRHYVNLNKTEFKFRKLLKDFQFSTIRQLLTQN